MAQLAEQLTCNQQVNGSSPFIGFLLIKVFFVKERLFIDNMGGFPSGQRGQTVNLLAQLSKVRILLRPLTLFLFEGKARGERKQNNDAG